MSQTASWPAPVTLNGDHVTLAPLELSHQTALAKAVEQLGPLWYTTIPTADGMAQEIKRRLSLPNMTPFTILTPNGAPVGMTTYMHTDAVNRRVEIGSTWLAKSQHGTKVNKEAKYLLLSHAFEQLDCISVEFRTHRLNTQSRSAIESLGAQLDGILRAHMIMPNGAIRDTACYSITAPEWPTVKTHLEHRLGRCFDRS